MNLGEEEWQKADLFLLNVSTSQSTNVTQYLSGWISTFNWSPDGLSIFFRLRTYPWNTSSKNSILKHDDSTTEYLIYNLESEKLTKIPLPGREPYSRSFNWSPTSELVVFEKGGGIYTFNIATDDTARISPDTIQAYSPSFGSNQEFISYSTYDSNGQNIIIQDLQNSTFDLLRACL